ncbi:MAG: hypothetical protein NW206_12935 [Hyphomonadaceae bacterium]|nr:hypothetical protein [Hyphomonadaceae bacterium]
MIIAILVLLALLLVLIGAAFMGWDDVRRRPLILGAMGVVGVGAAVAALTMTPRSAPQASDPFQEWSARIEARAAACPEDSDGAACLANAFRQTPPPEADESGTAAARFFHDVRLGEALLAQPKAEDILWREFGVDSADFIGTGYSVVFSGAQRSYEGARQIEYFAPNICADMIDTQRCPAELSNVWTWRLDSAAVASWLDQPIDAFFAAEPPADHLAEWTARRASRPFDDGSLVIRFSRFDPQYYAGTVGRPEAELVFFAALTDAREATLRDMLARTGSAPLAEPGEENETLFVWVYAPNAPLRTATWDALFDHLRSTP